MYGASKIEFTMSRSLKLGNVDDKTQVYVIHLVCVHGNQHNWDYRCIRIGESFGCVFASNPKISQCIHRILRGVVI